MMLLIASLLLPTSKRSLTRGMGVDGNVLWVLTLVASSPTHQGLSYISLWRPLISLFSRELLLEFSTLIQGEEIRDEILARGTLIIKGALLEYSYFCNGRIYDLSMSLVRGVLCKVKGRSGSLVDQVSLSSESVEPHSALHVIHQHLCNYISA